MSREISARVTRYANPRLKPPELPRAVQIPSPARGIDVASFAAFDVFPPFNGAQIWAEMHRRALVTFGDDSAYLETVTARLPCGTCKPHWAALLAAKPPTWGEAYFAWTVAAHNEVNARLGKPLVTVEEARAIWTA